MEEKKIVFKTSNKSDLGGPLNALSTLQILTMDNDKVGST